LPDRFARFHQSLLGYTDRQDATLSIAPVVPWIFAKVFRTRGHRRDDRNESAFVAFGALLSVAMHPDAGFLDVRPFYVLGLVQSAA